jgi:hypothetical protein
MNLCAISASDNFIEVAIFVVLSPDMGMGQNPGT